MPFAAQTIASARPGSCASEAALSPFAKHRGVAWWDGWEEESQM